MTLSEAFGFWLLTLSALALWRVTRRTPSEDPDPADQAMERAGEVSRPGTDAFKAEPKVAPASSQVVIPLEPIDEIEDDEIRYEGEAELPAVEDPAIAPPAPTPQSQIIAPPYASLYGCLPNDEFVVLDVETTGLDPRTLQITQVCAARITNLRRVKQADATSSITGFLADAEFYTTYCRLERGSRVPRRITELTGITGAILREKGVPLEEAMAKTLAKIAGMTVVCHNAQFDISFLTEAFRRCGIDAPVHSVCTMRLARLAWPHLGSHSLASLAATLRLDHQPRHDAEDDVKATFGLYCALLDGWGLARVERMP